MFSPKLFVTFVFSTLRDDKTRFELSSESTISVFARLRFSTRPRDPIASRKSFVLGPAKPNSSMMITLPSRTLSERAERKAPRRIFFGILYDQSRGCGPWTLPPPFHSGERSDAIRARPVPFCFQSLRPEPETFPRVFVADVPCRPFA